MTWAGGWPIIARTGRQPAGFDLKFDKHLLHVG
jgi:hypothetical protein